MMNQLSGAEKSGARCGCCPTGLLETRFRSETIEQATESGSISIQADRIPVKVCGTCGSVFVTGETLKARHEYVCRAVGAITPAEIRAIRDRHGLSQHDLARMTGFGEASISRWERGRLLPNPGNSTFLKLLLRHPHTVELLSQPEFRDEVRETPAIPL